MRSGPMIIMWTAVLLAVVGRQSAADEDAKEIHESNSAQRGSFAMLPARKLEDVVESYLEQATAIRTLEATYRVTQRDLRPGLDNRPRMIQEGLFGIADGLLAVRTKEQHAVFDGLNALSRVVSRKAFATEVNESLFSDHQNHPTLLFHRMVAPERTPLALILRDAVGPKRLGRATLREAQFKGDACYLIEGKYDRAKLNKEDSEPSRPWLYRLWLRPSRGLQAAKLQAFNVRESYLIAWSKPDGRCRKLAFARVCLALATRGQFQIAPS